MPSFSRDILDLAAREREVDLTTFGRKTSLPSRRTLWIWGDGTRLYIRSGGGLDRDWPRNLLANGRAVLHLAGRDIPVRARHVTDEAEARQGADLIKRKYHSDVRQSAAGAPLTPAEQATFELLPPDAHSAR